MKSRVLKLVSVILIGMLALGIILTNVPTLASPTIPQFNFPYTSNDTIYWTSGPHQINNFAFSGYYPKGQGSGLDFAGGGFTVRTMAAGTVLYKGWGLFGNQIVMQLDNSDVQILYGHLATILPVVTVSAHINQSVAIGVAGNSTPVPPMGVHLHVELRQDMSICTHLNNCGTAVDWDGVKVGDYRFYGIEVPNTSPQLMFNYDGSAIFDNGISPIKLTQFHFQDDDDSWKIGQVFASRTYSCPYTTQTCADDTLDEHSKFSIGNEYGLIGGGAEPLPSNTQPNQSTPVPTATPGQTGNSHVDLFENTNKGGTQYGWDNPTGGWTNLPNYLDEKVSSIDLDPSWSVLVSKDANGGGTHKCLVTSYGDLSGAYYDDSSPMTDTMSSVNVFNDATCGGAYFGTVPGDTVSFWVNSPYNGTVWGVHDLFSGNLPNYLQNSMTSIGVTPGWSAVLYDGLNLSGGFTCYTASSPDLTGTITNSGGQANDSIESVEVFHDTNCGGRMHAPTVNVLSAAVTNQNNGEVTITYNITGAAPGSSIHTNFGDGNSDFDIDGPTVNTTATHNYFPYGSYTIVVSVEGTDAATYQYLIPIIVTPPTPTYSVTINSANTASGLVNFTLDWNNALADWQHIDFGDGQSFDVNGASGHQSASHIYNPSANPYTLSFTVKDMAGQPHTTTQQISMPFPTVSLTLNSVDSVTGLVNYTAAWTNAPVDSWQRVDFGHDGVYVDYQGAADTKVDSHILPVGVYTLTFTVTGRNGQTHTATQQVVVTGPPTATPVPPTPTPAPPTHSLTIDSVDQNSGLTTFTLDWGNALADWHHIDFGDGQAFDVNGGSGHQQATHIYNPGTYSMTFTVKGLDGQNYPSTQQVTVSGPPTATPVPPTATPVPPTATPIPPTVSLTINSVDNATGVVTFHAVWSNALNDWQHMDFGHDSAYVDYQGGSGDHTDSNIIPVGTYTFTLTVKGLDGQNYTVSQQVTRS